MKCIHGHKNTHSLIVVGEPNSHYIKCKRFQWLRHGQQWYIYLLLCIDMISSMRPFARTPMRRHFVICLYRSIRFGLAIGIYRHRKVINNKDKIFFAPIGSLSLDLIFAETKTSNNWQNCFIPLIGDRQNFYIKCVKLDFFYRFSPQFVCLSCRYAIWVCLRAPIWIYCFFQKILFP